MVIRRTEYTTKYWYEWLTREGSEVASGIETARLVKSHTGQGVRLVERKGTDLLRKVFAFLASVAGFLLLHMATWLVFLF